MSNVKKTTAKAAFNPVAFPSVECCNAYDTNLNSWTLATRSLSNGITYKGSSYTLCLRCPPDEFLTLFFPSLRGQDLFDRTSQRLTLQVFDNWNAQPSSKLALKQRRVVLLTVCKSLAVARRLFLATFPSLPSLHSLSQVCKENKAPNQHQRHLVLPFVHLPRSTTHMESKTAFWSVWSAHLSMSVFKEVHKKSVFSSAAFLKVKNKTNKEGLNYSHSVKNLLWEYHSVLLPLLLV